jgi:hypothetical protein
MNSAGRGEGRGLGRVALPLLVGATLVLTLIPHGSRAALAAPGARAAPAAITVYDWGWENPLPQGASLGSVSCSTATMCKAVGVSGTILSWNGTSWSADDAGTNEVIAGVSCPTVAFCKAVSTGNTILSWNGTAWSGVSSPAAGGLYGVSCPTTTLCKAVGGFGAIVSWDGTNWSAESTNHGLSGVDCPTVTLCKAVSPDGAILSWNGTSWTEDSSGTTNFLSGVACATAAMCKAVGGDGTVMSWNGMSWSPDSSGAASMLRGVSCPTAARCKAVGDDGTILGLITQTLNDVDPGFALDLFQTGCLDGVTITQTNSNHPNATASQQTGKYWTITASPATCTSGYSAFLTLPTSFTPDAGSQVCRYTGSGMTWHCARNGFTTSSVSRWNVTQFSDWAASTSLPTVVRLSSLQAVAGPGAVSVRWRAGNEVGIVGFNVYRARGPSGPWTRLNKTLIRSRGAREGSPYLWLDGRARAGAAHWYRVAAVNVSGFEVPLGAVRALGRL